MGSYFYFHPRSSWTLVFALCSQPSQSQQSQDTSGRQAEKGLESFFRCNNPSGNHRTEEIRFLLQTRRHPSTGGTSLPVWSSFQFLLVPCSALFLEHPAGHLTSSCRASSPIFFSCQLYKSTRTWFIKKNFELNNVYLSDFILKEENSSNET